MGREEEKQMKHPRSLLKSSQENSEKARGMLYAPFQNTTAKLYALGINIFPFQKYLELSFFYRI